MDVKSTDFLKIASMIIFVLSLLEIISSIVLLFTPLNLRLEKLIPINLFLSEYFPVNGLIIVIFFLILNFFSLIFSVFFYQLSVSGIDDYKFSKYLLVIGLFLLTFTFIQLYYIVLWGDSLIQIGYYFIKFEDALFVPSIAPLYMVVIWNFYMVIICSYLTIGCVSSAWGLIDMLKFEKKGKDSPSD
jgi:predicted permease